WSEDGKMIAYTATEPTAQPLKDRKDYYGDYDVVREGYSYVHLWTLNVSEAMKSPLVGKQRTKKTDFSVDSFSWSPDGSTIAFSATLNPDLIQGTTADIYLLKLSDDSVKKIVDQPGPDNNPRFSPDGKQIVFSSAMGEKLFFASNTRLAIVSVDGGKPRSITDSFDENPGLVEWNLHGITEDGLAFVPSRSSNRQGHSRFSAGWSDVRVILIHAFRRSHCLYRCLAHQHKRSVRQRSA